MANESINIIIKRPDNKSPWGFRLKGGKDFGAPLLIDRLTSGALAERSGLAVGDNIIKINGQETQTLFHLQAQTMVKNSGNSIDFEVLRNGSVSPKSPLSPTGSSQDAFDYSVPKGRPRRPSLLNNNPEPFSPGGSTLQHSLPHVGGPNPHINLDLGTFVTSDDKSKSVKTTLHEETTTTEPFKHKAQVKTLPKESQQYKTPQVTPSVQPKSRSPTVQLENLSLAASIEQHEKSQKQKKPARAGDLGDLKTSKDSPFCNICRDVIRGSYYTAENKIYCETHFKCAQCSKSLNDCTFAERDGKLYCEKDYLELIAEVCARCSKPIVGAILSVSGKSWHTSCFLCYMCSAPIGGGVVHTNDDEEAICNACFEKHYQKSCHSCNKVIGGTDFFQESGGKQYHSTCFVCSVCGVSAKEKAFLTSTGKILCREHAGNIHKK